MAHRSEQFQTISQDRNISPCAWPYGVANIGELGIDANISTLGDDSELRCSPFVSFHLCYTEVPPSITDVLSNRCFDRTYLQIESLYPTAAAGHRNEIESTQALTTWVHENIDQVGQVRLSRDCCQAQVVKTSL